MPKTFISPISAAREAMRRFDYAGAHQVLVEAVKQNTQRTELARIANLITPCGMIAEAIDALNNLDFGLEEYKASPPAAAQRIAMQPPTNQLTSATGVTDSRAASAGGLHQRIVKHPSTQNKYELEIQRLS